MYIQVGILNGFRKRSLMMCLSAYFLSTQEKCGLSSMEHILKAFRMNAPVSCGGDEAGSESRKRPHSSTSVQDDDGAGDVSDVTPTTTRLEFPGSSSPSSPNERAGQYKSSGRKIFTTRGASCALKHALCISFFWHEWNGTEKKDCVSVSGLSCDVMTSEGLHEAMTRVVCVLVIMTVMWMSSTLTIALW